MYEHLLAALACCALIAGCNERKEGTEVGDCVDRADNDGDGAFDCDDDGCFSSPDCVSIDGGRDGGSSTLDGAAPDSGSPDDAGMADSGLPIVTRPCAYPSEVGCEPGQWCAPDFTMEDETGVCLNPGPGGDLADCATTSDCQEDFVCTEDGTCRRLCSHTTPGVCPVEGDAFCTELEGAADVLPDVGYCLRRCTTFGAVDDPGCIDGEWCRNTKCTVFGAAADGDPCEADMPRCGPGLGCIVDTCTRLCLTSAGPGEPGDACETDEVCTGICADQCDYDGAGVCPDPDDVCWPDTGSWSADACFSNVPDLPAGGDCAAAGLAPNDLCAQFAVCDTDNVCYDLCRPGVAPFGTTGHPDCRDSSTTCEGSPGAPYGFCR